MSALEALRTLQGKDTYNVGDMVMATGAHALEKQLKAVVDSASNAVTKKELQDAVTALTQLVQSIGPALGQAVSAIDESIAANKVEVPAVDLSGLEAAIKEASDSTPSFDDTNILLAVHSLRNDLPVFDVSEVLAMLGEMQMRIAELEKPKTFEFDIERYTSNPGSNIKKVTARQV